MTSENTTSVYERAGMTNRLGFGKKPALLVVDMQVGFTDPERSPIAGKLDAQIAMINRLIREARPKAVPVLFAAIGYTNTDRDNGVLWMEKIPTLSLLKVGDPLFEIDPRLERKEGDIVIVKQCASAFFGTTLQATLTARGIDTLIVTGCVTSGCIRATVVDAISHGFRPIVPTEAVGDRAEWPHKANLFDMNSKYGDVVPSDEVIEYFKRL